MLHNRIYVIHTYIRRVFDRKTPIIQMDHFFPLSGALFEFPLRAVGHLERFKEEWDTIIRPLYGITEEVHIQLCLYIYVHTFIIKKL